jgi:hypothetical protein
VVLRRTFLYSANCKNNLLGAGVLGDGLGAFRDGVFGQFSGEEEPDGGLDLILFSFMYELIKLILANIEICHRIYIVVLKRTFLLSENCK